MAQENKSIETSIARIEQDVKHIMKQVDKFATTNEMLIRLDEAQKQTEERTAKLEESQKWTWRALGSAIIAIVVDKLFI